MNKKIIHTDQAPAAIGPYSQAISFGNLVFTSGQIPMHPQTGEIVGENDIKAQTHQVFANLKAVLAAENLDFNNIIKAGVFITDMGHFAELNEVYAEYLGDIKPARSTVAVRTLPKNVLVEIEVIAHA